MRYSEDTTQQRHRHVLAHFSCNTACVYLPDLCVSVCRPISVTPSVPDRDEQVAYTAEAGMLTDLETEDIEYSRL